MEEMLHQLSLVVYPIIYDGCLTSQVVQDLSNSTTLFSKWAVIKNLVTFHYTGWSMGILITAYKNPYKTG